MGIPDDPIGKAFQAGVAKAIAEHKRAGRSIVVSRNGKVVIVPPEEIRVPRIPRSRNTRTTE
jgi:hypothetical protein